MPFQAFELCKVVTEMVYLSLCQACRRTGATSGPEGGLGPYQGLKVLCSAVLGSSWFLGFLWVLVHLYRRIPTDG